MSSHWFAPPPSSLKMGHVNAFERERERERERETIGGITCTGVEGKFVRLHTVCTGIL